MKRYKFLLLILFLLSPLSVNAIVAPAYNLTVVVSTQNEDSSFHFNLNDLGLSPASASMSGFFVMQKNV